MALFNAYSARNAKVRFGAVVATVKSWNVAPKADKFDTTNSEGGGYGEKKTGIREVTVTIELYDNGSLNYFNAGITPGAIVNSVKLYLNDTSGPFWSFPFFWIESCPMAADVRDGMKLTIQGESNGPFFLPSTLAGTTT